MLSPERYSKSRPLRTAGFALLLILLALTFAAEGSQPFHTHEDGTPGLYNGDCALAELAAFDGISQLPPSPPSPWIALVTGSAPVATFSDRSELLWVGGADSRAPPAPLA